MIFRMLHLCIKRRCENLEIDVKKFEYTKLYYNIMIFLYMHFIIVRQFMLV